MIAIGHNGSLRSGKNAFTTYKKAPSPFLKQ